MLTALELRIRPAHVVLAALATLAMLAALATFSGGGRPGSSTEVGRVTPTSVFLPIAEKVSTTVVDEAPAPAVAANRPRTVRQPAAQTGTSQPAAQDVGTATGGDTNVTVDNGSSDTETESGGAHVGNRADVSANSSTTGADEDGDPNP